MGHLYHGYVNLPEGTIKKSMWENIKCDQQRKHFSNKMGLLDDVCTLLFLLKCHGCFLYIAFGFDGIINGLV